MRLRFYKHDVDFVESTLSSVGMGMGIGDEKMLVMAWEWRQHGRDGVGMGTA